MPLLTPASHQPYSIARAINDLAAIGENERAIVAATVGVSRQSKSLFALVELHECSAVVHAKSVLCRGADPPHVTDWEWYRERRITYGRIPAFLPNRGDVGLLRMIAVIDGTRDGYHINPLRLSVVRLAGRVADDVNQPEQSAHIAQGLRYDSVNALMQDRGRPVPIEGTWLDGMPDAQEIDRALRTVEAQLDSSVGCNELVLTL